MQRKQVYRILIHLYLGRNAVLFAKICSSNVDYSFGSNLTVTNNNQLNLNLHTNGIIQSSLEQTCETIANFDTCYRSDVTVFYWAKFRDVNPTFLARNSNRQNLNLFVRNLFSGSLDQFFSSRSTTLQHTRHTHVQSN